MYSFQQKFILVFTLFFLSILCCEPALKDYDETEIYHHNPKISNYGLTSGSNDLRVTENDDHKIEIEALSKKSKMASKYDFSTGKAVYLPDEVNSKNIKVVVNKILGYTTFAGLKFKHDATVNIWENGTIEVNRKGIEAEDDDGNKYISKKVAIGKKVGYVMMQAH